MSTFRRSALVARPASRLYALVNDIEAYPRRFDWCEGAEVLERSDDALLGRLQLGVAGIGTWFTTANTLVPDRRIAMQLRDGPFKRLDGTWTFTPLREDACKVELALDFEPSNPLVGAVVGMAMQSLADRMVDDFIRVAMQDDLPDAPTGDTR